MMRVECEIAFTAVCSLELTYSVKKCCPLIDSLILCIITYLQVSSLVDIGRPVYGVVALTKDVFPSESTLTFLTECVNIPAGGCLVHIRTLSI